MARPYNASGAEETPTWPTGRLRAPPNRFHKGAGRHARSETIVARWFGWLSGEAELGVQTPAEPAGGLPAMQGRRDRVLAGGQQVLLDSLAEKVLHGWMQNRHQTLFPLTVNLRSLRPDQAQALAGWAAVAASATGTAGDAAARGWLVSAGASPAMLDGFAAALASPPPLDAALQAVARHGLAPYAYVAALVAADPQDPAAAPFLDYVAARLALPATVVRSAQRRYRR